MTKFPLTPQGVGQKVDELNALTRSKLIEQTGLINFDLKNWLKSNFTLSSAAVQFIDGMNDAGTSTIGRLISDAVLSSTSITYVAPEPPASYSGKNVDVERKERAKVDAAGGYIYESTLVITVTYV